MKTKRTLFPWLNVFGRRAGCRLLTFALALLPWAVEAATGDADGFNANLNNYGHSAIMQSDGKILVGGEFNQINFQIHNYLARYSSSGQLDPDYDPALTVGSFAYCMVAQDDGKVLLGTQNNFARVSPGGTFDAAFNPNVQGRVNAIALQADGKILIGGWFLTVGGVARTHLARLNSDGTLDSAFNLSAQAGYVNTFAVQPDGKILVGGSFTFLNGLARGRLARLSADGTIETNFNPIASGDVNALALQPDGKILVGGDFTNLAATVRTRLARLNSDGTLDTNFNSAASATVNTLVLQADGKILAGGMFTTVAGAAHTFAARLNSDGSPDATFNTTITILQPAYEEVRSIALQADGRVLMAGFFAVVNGLGRQGFARLENDAATESLTSTSTNRVQWLRGGSAPEAQGVTFELSTNGGNNYALLGSGTRISGGWELTGLHLPGSGLVRARARAICGKYNGSSELVETVAAFGPLIAVFTGASTAAADQRTNNVGTNLFAASLVGSSSPPQTFTIKNVGATNLTGLAVTVTGVNAGDFVLGALGTNTLAVNATTSFTVTFAPAAVGARRAVVAIASNDGNQNPFRIQVAGYGLAPATYPYSQAVLADHPLGYWRLDETSGTVAVDYTGVNNGAYTNALLGQPGNNLVSSHTAAQFGSVSNINSYVGGVPIGFATPGNAAFSVECWANGGAQTNDSGLITRGTSGFEQFNLDCGFSVSHAFRFFVRDAAGGVHLANGNVLPNNTWHHLVGVCDQANGKVILYVDGISNASSTITPGSGLLNSANATTFGSRQSGTNVYDNQFVGSLEEVAIYGNALSAAQVLLHYQTATVLTASFAGTPVSGLKPLVVNFNDTSVGTITNRFWNFGDGSTTNTAATNFTHTYAAAGTNTVILTIKGPAGTNTLTRANYIIVTNPSPPAVTTLAANGVASTSATLNGTVNPNGAVTTAYFQYGLTTNYGSYSATNSLAATNTVLSVSNLISSLSPGTTYHFRIVGSNSVGTSLGADLAFTTSPIAPLVTTVAASGITATNAVLNGTVNPDGAVTTAYFQYGLTTNYGGYSATNSLAATNTALSVSTLIGSLSPGTTYHFRIVGSNSVSTTLGADLAFTTSPIAPSVTTVAASGITATNAMLNGTVNPNGAVTTAYFQYGLTTNYGSYSATNSLAATNTALPVSNLIGGLSPGTTYHFRIVGSNSVGTTLGADLAFTTSPVAPSVTTVAASGITAINAMLNGTVNPNGGATTAYFQYGLTTNYGSYSATNSLAATNTALSVSNLISSLSPGTTYHYKLVGSNSAGTILGGDLMFTTASSQPVDFIVSGYVQLPGGAFQLSFTNLSGLPFTVLGATDAALPLSNWTVLGAASEAPPGQYQFTDTQATNSPIQFYRVRSP